MESRPAINRCSAAVLAVVTITALMVSVGCSTKPEGVDLRPITSLQFTAGPDFLAFTEFYPQTFIMPNR